MKAITSLLLLLIFTGVVHSKEEVDMYIGSTPAGTVVKRFLGIALRDSVDYIRWKLMLPGNGYSLQCRYQVVDSVTGKVKENKEVTLKGKLVRENNHYTIYNNEKTLRLERLHSDLLHLSEPDNRLMIGNGGWSYTINHSKKTAGTTHFIHATPAPVKDSMIFIGRTPCGVPGINMPGGECYKLKWKIVFYGNSNTNQPGNCKVYATPYRQEVFKPGHWKIINAANGRIFYHLYDESGKSFLYFEKADDNILLFTDANGKLLIGDEDYSFTLNRSANR